MCVDLSHLHKHVVHEHYQSSTPAQTVIEIAASEAKIFTVYLGSAKPTLDYTHYPIWEIQIPQSINTAPPPYLSTTTTT